jgi:hypothetical protein
MLHVVIVAAQVDVRVAAQDGEKSRDEPGGVAVLPG